MVVVRFVKNRITYTWFISDNFIAFSVFFVVLLGGTIIKIFTSKKNNKQFLSDTRGGTDNIISCVKPNGVYERIDPALKLLFRKRFKQGDSVGPVIINIGVFFYSWFALKKNPIISVMVNGVEIYITNIVTIILKSGISGSLAVLLLNCFGTSLLIKIMGGVVFAMIIGFNISNSVNCNDLVRELPQSKIGKEKVVFLDEPPERLNDKIFIVGTEETKIYVPKQTDYEWCLEESEEAYLEIDNINPVIPWQRFHQKEKIVRRKCYSDRKYIPLKLRTKTLQDLKKDDFSKEREMTDASLEKFENKRIDN